MARPCPLTAFSGRLPTKHNMLVDDVLTTGETVDQCIKVLKKAGGAREVAVLTVARTVAR